MQRSYLSQHIAAVAVAIICTGGLQLASQAQQTTKSTTVTRQVSTPYISSIPILGSLFRDASDDGSLTTQLAAQPIYWQFPDSNETVTLLSGSSPLKERVDAEIDDMTVRDAIKKIIGKHNISYRVDTDVPTETHVTLKANGVSIATAINMLIESVKIGCVQTVVSKISESNGSKHTTSQVELHFSKKETAPLSANATPWTLYTHNLTNQLIGDKGYWATIPGTQSNNNFKLRFDGANKLLLGTSADLYNNKVLQLNQGSSPYVYDLLSTQQRSTFTCPFCKQQVTIIKKIVTPKCPTCGKVFEGNWKFCPVDGTKRPEDAGDWKFCPHCGKAVP